MTVPTRTRGGALQLGLECLALGVAYATAAHLSLKLAALGPNITPVWPPAGIALAFLLLRGRNRWPGVLLGALLGLDLSEVTAPTALLYALSNTLEISLAAWLVERYAGGAEPFHRARDAARFVTLGCLLAPVLGATLATAATLAGPEGAGLSASSVWLTWWAGDAVGTLLVAPLLLLWFRPTAPSQAGALEKSVLWLLTFAAGYTTFADVFPAETPLDYVVGPPLIWAAFRLSLREATRLTGALLALTLTCTALGLGPFHSGDANLSLLSAQGFLGSIQLAVLLIGSLLAERQEAMAQAVQARDALEARVQDRTDELLQAVSSLQQEIAARDAAQKELGETQQQLRQLEKMEALGRLAGGIAHDFNNMLTAMLMQAEQLLLEVPPDREDWRQALLEIREAGRRSAALTGQLLAFSRKKKVRAASVRLQEVIPPLRDMLSRLLGEDVRLEVELSPDLPPVRADRTQMEQVLVNLAVNARDAMPEGGVIRVTARPTSMPGGKGPGAEAVCVQVEDSGCGMDEEVLSHLFEPFFTTKTEGTGLGLSTVYGIVHQNEGTLDVESERGKGTTFRLYFRVAPPAETSESSPASLPSARGGETVLLVEDEAVVRLIVKKVLKSAGYTVLEGSDGSEGLEIAERFPGKLDLLVTDVVMPGLGGGELASRLRAARPQMQVLFISGYTPEALAQHGVDPSAGDFLQKPFTPQALASKVRELLDRMAVPQGS